MSWRMLLSEVARTVVVPIVVAVASAVITQNLTKAKKDQKK